ncbi:MAG: hypothetical protein PVG91_06490 [Gammaproteobacteria bacterium]|jgi:hypothetical protein
MTPTASGTLYPAILLLASLLAGCAMEQQSRADFERHNRSILRDSYAEPGMLVFEAKAGAAFPAESQSAEATRMQWLESWLAQRKLCPAGYEVLSRESIGAGEPNFHNMDLRYRLRCVDAPPEAAP